MYTTPSRNISTIYIEYQVVKIAYISGDRGRNAVYSLFAPVDDNRDAGPIFSRHLEVYQYQV